MKINYATLLSALIFFAACGEPPNQAKTEVDTILHSGKVVTLDSASTIASAIAIKGERIVAVGGDEILELYAANETVDLQGKTLLPGFVDSHTHIGGRPQRFIDLAKTASITQLIEQVRDKASELGPDEWITGYGWSEDQMEEQRRPLRSDLDQAAPGNPVMLTRAGGHSAVANSIALQLAGVDRNTADPDGGIIEKDATGELNGVIRERQEIVGRLIPEPTDEEVRGSLIEKLRHQFSLGITSVVQAMDSIEHYAEWERIYDAHRGRLPRAAVQVFWEGADEMSAFGRLSGDGDDHLRVGPIKIFVDGGFTGPAAFTKEPYRGEDEYRGMLDLTVEELRSTIRAANAAGWQLGIHAIGDAAIEITVDELTAALDENPRDDHRHYLNHFTVMPSAETMNKMAEYGIAITQQPNFTYTLEGRYVAYLDGERLARNNPLRTPMNHGIHVAISADILPIGPLVGIYAAVTRKGMSGEVFGADEALTIMEALRGYTWGGAYLTFEEDQKGTIEAGKLADLIVFDKDILTVDAEEIPGINVEQTWLGGKLVFSQ